MEKVNIFNHSRLEPDDPIYSIKIPSIIFETNSV